MATNYIAITNGTETVQIANDTALTNYLLERDVWGPSIAGLRTAMYASRSPFNDVEESMVLNIRGTSVANCYSNLDVLKRLLDQAELWAKGADVAPVLLKYSPQGATVSSDINPLTTVILGRSGNDETSGVALSSRFSESAQTTMIRDVAAKFRRRGLWLGASETVASASSSHDSLWSCVFAQTVATPSPIKVVLETHRSGFGGFLLMNNDSTKIKVTTPLFWSSVGVPGNAPTANGSAVLIMRASDLSSGNSHIGTVDVTALENKRVYMFIKLRVTGTLNWTIYARDQYITGTETRTKILRPSGNPSVICLGIVSATTDVSIHAKPVSAGTDTDTIEVDVVYYCSLDTQIITFLPKTVTTTDPEVTAAITIDHQLLTKPEPALYKAQSSVSYRGNPVIAMSGDRIVSCFAVTEGVYWRPYAANNRITATRTIGYTTPQ